MFIPFGFSLIPENMISQIGRAGKNPSGASDRLRPFYGLATEFVSKILHQYFMDTKAVTRETLRQELASVGIKGLLKITALIKKVMDFLEDSYNKFTAEGD